jgi:hypothetical protein
VVLDHIVHEIEVAELRRVVKDILTTNAFASLYYDKSSQDCDMNLEGVMHNKTRVCHHISLLFINRIFYLCQNEYCKMLSLF